MSSSTSKSKTASKSPQAGARKARPKRSRRSKPAASTQAAPPAQTPLHDHNRLDDTNAYVGRFATVVKGKHEGRYGVVDSIASFGEDGYPKTVVFQTRDERDDRLEVDYDALRPDVPGKR